LRENFELDLFNSKRSIFIFIAITILILIYNIFIKYQIYNDIKTKRVQEIKATVLNQYIKQKGAKKHTVDGWSAIGKAGMVAEIKKICPNAKESALKDKYMQHYLDFAVQFASDSGNVPSC
jgi:hypothetical protein